MAPKCFFINLGHWSHLSQKFSLKVNQKNWLFVEIGDIHFMMIDETCNISVCIWLQFFIAFRINHGWFAQLQNRTIGSASDSFGWNKSYISGNCILSCQFFSFSYFWNCSLQCKRKSGRLEWKMLLVCFHLLLTAFLYITWKLFQKKKHFSKIVPAFIEIFKVTAYIL